ncbi:nitroreductase [Candidatus Pacearchaeota archaeon CG1_02_32_132]|nr:MAG: nitroreductase [Candidatus Pacearchaeota archaeon CG1_02_32_132]
MEYTKGSEIRKSDYPIHDLILDRWSPRAMSGDSISQDELMRLFEAARWAPSSSNIQPWRFVYAHKDGEYWDKFFGLLSEFNQTWCNNAGVLAVLLAKKTDDNGKENRNHLSDAGAAWENLALQGSSMGLVVHGMAGYNVEKAREELKIPEDYDIVHMIAIGKPADKEVLHERMQKSENPGASTRKLVGEFVFEGEFKE